MREEHCYGLELYEPQAGARSGQFTYMAGVQVSDLSALPQGVSGYTIPGGRYAVFTHVGSTELLGETFGYIYGEWLPASGETLREMNGTHSFDLEFYGPRFQEGRADSELQIYVPLN
ncbi:GyrI-like domain-containing protein [Paenibacillus sp. OV219]|uniref:GyrI-like domain-containing protein n=1 Tax=Paenibacillus sp. OV219 TaxID=1884377 RepID=UPI0008AE54DC|nr:GyrI-like domain-containing protein [Paenibacillus sp. OV219]SEN54377.1 AraC family transcriptional regulator [Paenibacillus sp. OV219]